jgi:hypothetical protein
MANVRSALISRGINFVNSTTAGLVNYTVCGFWDQVNQIALNSSSGNATNLGGNGTNSTGIGNSAGTASTGGASGVVVNAVMWIIADFAMGACSLV